MCGISGVFGERNPELIRKMSGRLVHRGPDDEGMYAGSGATLGMRRLAIIDLENGQQPIANEDGSLSIVFNGEIYNYRELRRQLQGRHRFKTASDTEVILHCFEEHGLRTPTLLRGDFAFAIWDEKRERGFLARDHLGVKPLYYTASQGRLLFSSELKGLVADERLSLEISPEAFDLYLALLYIPHPWTIYRDVFKLPPGSLLEYARGRHRIVSYWNPPLAQRPAPQVEPEMDERVLSRLREAVAYRLVGDVPVSVFLSGGMDSSAIVALAAHSSSQPLKTFSIGYTARFGAFDELPYSRLVARRYGTDHHECIIEPDLPDTVRRLARLFDEPFADSSALPTYLVSQYTSGSVKVALSGIGGDELFGGYPRYLGAVWDRHYGRLPLAFRRMLSALLGHVPETESSRNLGGWVRRFVSHPEDTFSERYRRWMTFLDRQARGRLYSPEFAARLESENLDEEYFRDLFRSAEGWPAPEQAMSVDLRSYLVNDLLWMGDQMGMANSLEIRVPFCDHLLVEEVSACPWSRRFSGTRLKKMMKTMLKGELPEAILRHRKQGFMVPIGSWMRQELEPLFCHYLSPDKLLEHNMLRPSAVQELWHLHRSGRARLTHQLWALFVFQVWYEKMKHRLSG